MHRKFHQKPGSHRGKAFCFLMQVVKEVQDLFNGMLLINRLL